MSGPLLLSFEGWAVVLCCFVVGRIGPLLQLPTKILRGINHYVGPFTDEQLKTLRSKRKRKDRPEDALPDLPRAVELEQKSIVYRYDSLSQQQFKRMTTEQKMKQKIEFEPPILMSHFSRFDLAVQAGVAALLTFLVNDSLACCFAKRHNDTTLWILVGVSFYCAYTLLEPLRGSINIEVRLSQYVGAAGAGVAMCLLNPTS